MTTREIFDKNPNHAIALWMDKNTNDGLRAELEMFFQEQIRNHPRFSREDIFHHYRVNAAFSISFWPTSESFNKYGQSVTVITVVGTEVEMKEIAINMMNKKPTSGDIKLKVLSSIQGKEITINSNDVYEIWSQNH